MFVDSEKKASNIAGYSSMAPPPPVGLGDVAVDSIGADLR